MDFVRRVTEGFRGIRPEDETPEPPAAAPAMAPPEGSVQAEAAAKGIVITSPPEVNFTRQYAYLGPDMALTQLYDGQYIFVDPQDEEISIQIIARGYWEVWVEKAVRAMIKPGNRIIEIGANIGYYTLLMAKDIGAHGRLYSYEANQRLVKLLNASTDFNGYGDRAFIRCNAVSNSNEVMSFVARRRRSGSGRLLDGGGAPPEDAETISVQGVRLDDAFPDEKIDMIRIDAEGAEPWILEGAANLISRSPNLKICMEWDMQMMGPRADIPSMVRGLAAEGLTFWLIEYDGSVTSLTEDELMALPHRDVVATRRHPFS